MFNSGTQKDLETTCTAMVEFSNNQETNQDFAEVDETQDSAAK